MTADVARRLGILAGLALLGVPGGADAHTGTRSSLRVSREGAEVTVSIEATNREVGDVLGLNQDVDTPATRAQLEQASARVFRTWARGVSVRAGGKACPAADGGQGSDVRDGERTTIQTLVFSCGRGRLEIDYHWYFDRDARHQAFVRVDRPEGGVDAFVLDEGHRTHALDLEPSAWTNAVEFARSGLEHIFTGYDHIMFLIALLLMAGLKVREAGLRPGLLYATKVITGFTLGHSVTLALAALEVVRPNTRVVESAIAASILFVAVENLLAHHPRPRTLLTALFGLVHGFGFAGVLAEEGLPRNGLVLSLVSFNVGIEAGQLAIVVLLVLPLALSARRAWFRRALLVPGSVAIAAFAAVWLAERVVGFKVLPI